MPSTARQFDLFGGLVPPQDLDLQAKVAYVMENHPETRDDDRLLTLWYWWTWDGLDSLMSYGKFEDFVKWAIRTAEKPETIRRRRQEIQLLRSGVGTMQPSATVAATRRERDGSGPPGRKRR